MYRLALFYVLFTQQSFSLSLNARTQRPVAKDYFRVSVRPKSRERILAYLLLLFSFCPFERDEPGLETGLEPGLS